MQYLLANGRHLRIRPARVDDAAELLEMYREVVTESDNLMTSPEEARRLTLQQEKDFLASYAHSENQLFLVAEVEGGLAGTLSVTQAKLKKQAHLAEFGIVVRKQYWNMGIARRLMHIMQQWVENHPLIRYLHLSVLSQNEKAIHLYRNFGFQEQGLRPKAVQFSDGSFGDLLLMGKWVDPVSPLR